VDHYEIQRKLNRYFYQWHAILKDLDPAAKLLATRPTFWLSLLHHHGGDDELEILHPDSTIPVD
jgi:hypothetical protein